MAGKTKIPWKDVQEYYNSGRLVRECQDRFGFKMSCWRKAIKRGNIKTNPLRTGEKRPWKEDLSGRTFNDLTAISVSKEKTRLGFRKWTCLCKCGNTTTAITNQLLHGGKKSCGCRRFLSQSKSHCWRGVGEIPSVFWKRLIYHSKRGLGRTIPVDVTPEYAWDLFLKQNRKCALSGVEISFGERGKTTASVDRIDPSSGYIPGNIQWVHKDVNAMKFDLQQNEFLDFVKKIYAYRELGT